MGPNTLERHFHRHDWIGAILAWIACPGYVVVTKLEWSQRLWQSRLPGAKLLGRLIWRSLVTRHGCHFSLLARYGPGLTIPHPVGIVVGEEAVIGSNVTLYQGVTLGRRHHHTPGCPLLEDGVIVYANAVVAGDIRIGRGATIAANALVLKDVAMGETVAGNPARPLRGRTGEGKNA